MTSVPISNRTFHITLITFQFCVCVSLVRGLTNHHTDLCFNTINTAFECYNQSDNRSMCDGYYTYWVPYKHHPLTIVTTISCPQEHQHISINLTMDYIRAYGYGNICSDRHRECSDSVPCKCCDKVVPDEDVNSTICYDSVVISGNNSIVQCGPDHSMCVVQVWPQLMSEEVMTQCFGNNGEEPWPFGFNQHNTSSDSTEAESDATSMLHWLYARSVRLHYSCHPTTPHHTTHTLPIYRLGRPGRHTTAIGELDKTHNITCEKLLFGRFCITYPRIATYAGIVAAGVLLLVCGGITTAITYMLCSKSVDPPPTRENNIITIQGDDINNDSDSDEDTYIYT